MPSLIDEYTRECLDIRVERRLNIECCHRRSHCPVHRQRCTGFHTLRQRARVCGSGGERLDSGRRGESESTLSPVHPGRTPPAKASTCDCAMNCSMERSSTDRRRHELSLNSCAGTTTPKDGTRRRITDHRRPKRSSTSSTAGPSTNIQTGRENGGQVKSTDPVYRRVATRRAIKAEPAKRKLLSSTRR